MRNMLFEFRDGRFKIALAKQAGARNECIRTCPCALHCCLQIDSSIHANAIVEFIFSPPISNLLDFGQGFMDEFLAAETRVHCHNEDEVNFVQKRLEERDGCGRIDSKAHFFAKLFDFPDERFHFLAKFHMDDNLVRARFGKRFQKDFRARTHEMNIKKKIGGQRTDGFYHLRAKGNIGNKMAVHDVEMQPISLGMSRSGGSFSKGGVVGCKQGRRNNHGINKTEILRKEKAIINVETSKIRNVETAMISRRLKGTLQQVPCYLPLFPVLQPSHA